MNRFLFVCALALCCAPAYAADVQIPWGDWLSAALTYFREVVVAVVVAGIGWTARKLPGQAGEIITAMRLEQLLTRAVDYGLAAVEGSAKGKVLTVGVTNSVIAEAVSYAVRSAPGLAEQFAGSLRAKVLARLSAQGVVPAEASAANVAAVIK